MSRKSAGILLFRKQKKLEVLLVHPGGPFWQKKDLGAWSIPKGEIDEQEDPLAAAKREFKEETGMEIDGDFTALDPVIQKGGKTVYAWAVEGDLDPENIAGNTFSLQWPPGSGKARTYPEVDRAAWFDLPAARQKINDRQAAFLDALETLLRKK